MTFLYVCQERNF